MNRHSAVIAVLAALLTTACGGADSGDITAPEDLSGLGMLSTDRAGEQPLIPQGLLTACRHALAVGQLDGCRRLARHVEDQRSKLELACAQSKLISVKTELILDLLSMDEEIQPFALEELGVEDLDFDEICDRALDRSVTFVQIEPDPIELEVEETKDVKAIIRCSNGTCEGDLSWRVDVPPEPPIAEVAETFVDAMGSEHADVTGVRPGETTLFVVVAAFVIEGQPWVLGTADIQVGEKPIADIVFVIENSVELAFWFGVDPCCSIPGLRGHGQDLIDGLKDAFDFRSRVAIVNYNRPNVFPYQNFSEQCVDFFPPNYDAPVAAATAHQGFRFLLSSDDPHLGFESLKVTCAGADDGDYVGAFAYSALLLALDGSSLGGWRDTEDDRPVKRVIVMIGWGRPGGVLGERPYTNDPEALTGFTREQVIAGAQADDVEIHYFNVGTSTFLLLPGTIHPGSREAFTQIATETDGTYQEPQFAGTFPDDQLYLGIIDRMDEMAN